MVTAVAAVTLAGPGSSLAQTPTQGGAIVAAIEGEPTSVDPAFDYDFVSGLATSQYHGAIARLLRERLQAVPQPRTTWTVSPDGLTYTLNRSGRVSSSTTAPP